MEKNTAAFSEDLNTANEEMLNQNVDTENVQPVENVINEDMQTVQEEVVTEEPSSEEPSSDFVNYSSYSLGELVDIFKKLIEGNDHIELYKQAENIKSTFYKTLHKEKAALGLDAQNVVKNEDSDGENDANTETVAVVESNPFLNVEREFKDLFQRYKNDRAVYMRQQEAEKEENLAKKLAIIEELKQLLDKPEDVNKTFHEYKELLARWKQAGKVPQSRMNDVSETFQHYTELFYDYIKINNEFRDLDFKKNLESKTALCEKAEALENEGNVVNAFKALQKLHEEWKEIGPVAKEERDKIWERFKSISSVINKKHQHFFEQLKDDQKNNLAAKTEICEKAEEIAAINVTESNEWNTLSQKMEDLQAQWKTIGFASKKDNQKIYDRFRLACDKFYNAKREYYANFKSVMAENLKKKESLCEKAEELMNSDNWKKVTDQLINLQKEWKEIGPVARKQSDAVWKRFRAACDTFFDRKDKHYGAEDEKFEENLVLKNNILAEIESYQVKDNKDENILAMKEFQHRWSEVGFVPFKDKERIQQAFNSVMDAKFADIRSVESEKKLIRFKKMIADAKSAQKGDKSLRFEREKLIQKFRKIESNISTLENNMGFFAKSKNADSYIKDIEKKIEVAKEELAQIEEKIKIIDQQFE